jgi:hypothetical protein
MIRSLENQDYFYLVTCADLECVVLSSSFEEAACSGLKKILEEKKSKTNLSLIISVDFLDKKDYETQVFYTSNILNDLGHFKLAKDLESLSDFFLDKGENTH